jgi:hypothetical protein
MRGPGWLAALALAALFLGDFGTAQSRTTPKFFPDDPIARDDDTAMDASKVAEFELSENYDFLSNTFASPGDRNPRPAMNVNTLGEVPDSSWFTNRIGVRDMPVAEVLRGPNKFERLDAEEWTIVRGKGPGGFHPGFRAVHPGDPKQVYQLEVDPPDHPQMASGAEFIGTLIYHALGYNVVDVYNVRVDPARITIAPDATIRDASGVRTFTRGDLDGILRLAARDDSGRVYMTATRFEEGRNIGHFEYHGTRPDDPNDIHPHEHRRELRANRVFAAWLNHDDSRAVNTLNMVVEEKGRRYVRHYMYDFGAILGSATRFPDAVASGHEYYIDKGPNVRALATLGLAPPRYIRGPYPDMPPSAGFVSSVAFEPERWRANYPNAAFANMRPDDAFWGARLVGRFSNELLRAIVDHAGFDDRAAADHLVRTLRERRDRILQTWLTGVNPLVDFRLTSDGQLSFSNAAVDAGVVTAPARYRLAWSRFDNESGVQTPEGTELESDTPSASAPASLLARGGYISVRIRTEHPRHPSWREPVDVYFRREGGGWKAVGLVRSP